MADGNQVTIIGCGLMGPGIATCAALAGHTTVLQARSTERIKRGVDAAHKNLAGWIRLAVCSGEKQTWKLR
jgi:3-hydroxyacyl-CoA dehydrogenase